MNYQKIIDSLAKQYSLDIRNVDDKYIKESGMPKSEFVNKSFCCGKIVLGVYKNKGLRFVSFLHELGHKKFDIKKCSSNPLRNEFYMLEESYAWKWAMEYAKENDIKVSKKSLIHARRCLKSYCKWEYFKNQKNPNKKTIDRIMKIARLK